MNLRTSSESCNQFGALERLPPAIVHPGHRTAIYSIPRSECGEPAYCLSLLDASCSHVLSSPSSGIPMGTNHNTHLRVQLYNAAAAGNILSRFNGASIHVSVSYNERIGTQVLTVRQVIGIPPVVPRHPIPSLPLDALPVVPFGAQDSDLRVVN